MPTYPSPVVFSIYTNWCSRPDTGPVGCIQGHHDVYTHGRCCVSTLWFAILRVVYRLQYAGHINESVNVCNPGRQGSQSILDFVRGQVGFNDVETGRGLNGLMEGRDAY